MLSAPPVLIFDSPRMRALIYVKVDDVHATIASLRADEVEIVTEPFVIFATPTTVWDRAARRVAVVRQRLRGQPDRFVESSEARGLLVDRDRTGG